MYGQDFGSERLVKPDIEKTKRQGWQHSSEKEDRK